MRTSFVAAASVATAIAAASARGDYLEQDRLSTRTQALMWPAYVVGAMIVASNAADSRLHGTPLSRFAGAAVAGAGAGAVVAGAQPFRSFSQLAGRDSGDLITDGIYRYSRNPQYFGNVLVAGGAAVAACSVPALLFALAVFGGYSWYLPAEEAHLERTFGETYRAYRDRTSRWFGRG